MHMPHIKIVEIVTVELGWKIVDFNLKKKKSLKMNDLSIQIEIVVVVIVVLGMGGWNLEEESTAR